VSERGSVKAWVLAFVLSAALGLGALLGIGRLVGANKLPGEAQAKPTSMDGRTLYFEANCAGCHGIEGKGSRGPSLVAGPLAELSVEELIAKISKGKPLATMPRFRNILTEQQIRAVAEYVVELRTGAQS